MASIQRYFTIILLFVSPLLGWSSHIHGGEIFYQYIGDSTGIPNHYEAHVNLFRRYVGGAALPTNISMAVNVSCGTNFNIVLDKYMPSGAIPAGDGGHFPPIEECVDITNQTNLYRITVHSYKKAFVLGGNCIHTLSVDILGRTFPDNLNPYSGNIYLSTIIDNQLGDNSSPRFEQFPQVYHCVNQNVISNYSVIEEEGDSVYYQLVTPESNGTPYGYQTGFSTQQPISTNSGVFLDSLFGIMLFSPDVQQRVAVKVQVNEYRYDSTNTVWQKIGEASRDITLTIGATCSNSASDFYIEKDAQGFDTLAIIYCKDSIIRLHTEQPYLMASLALDGSDFMAVGDSSAYPIVSVASFDSINSQYAMGVEIHLLSSIRKSDTIIIYPQSGSDQNSLINHCGYEIVAGDSVQITAMDTCVWIDPTSGMVDRKLEDAVVLYPNPADDILNVKSSDALRGEIFQIELVNSNGQMICSKQDITSHEDIAMDVNNLDTGLYLVVFRLFDGEVIVKKVILE